MARLNEPAAPVEPIEALKRRFVRQNREIARANSTQSLRIRNLEAETSRLLSENLTLREQVINLQNELNGRPRKQALDDLGIVKDKLEIKLAELGSLVFELGKAQRSALASTSPSRRRTQTRSPKRSPDQRNWKNALTLSEVTGGQDGRLPPIVEDKYFPRRTLDAEDMLCILSDPGDSADSPDLGPPPVAHFDDGDPVKYDSSQNLGSDAADFRPSTAFANLETRKKRRESSFTREPHQNSSLEDTSAPIGNLSSQPLKLGAKRKLSVRDDEEKDNAPADKGKDEFRFNRRTNSSAGSTANGTTASKSVSSDLGGNMALGDLAVGRGASREKDRDTATTSATGRKALGEKSVNTDPVVSPHKTSRTTSTEKLTDVKKDIFPKKPRDRDRERVREKSTVSRPVQPSGQQRDPKPVPVESSPALSTDPTPATPIAPDLNLFSPISSEPSTARPDSRDTPPPPDLHAANSTTATNGRASRRARGSVSYAEPNLRDKMRRPGKELVDAVGADERAQKAVSTKAEAMEGIGGEKVGSESESTATKPKVRTVIIKREEEAEERGGLMDGKSEQRAEPGSPLSSKTGQVSSLPASVITERRRGVSVPTKGDEPDATKPTRGDDGAGGSGSSSTIAALLAATGRKQHQRRTNYDGSRAAGVAHKQASSDTATNPFDVYEFHCSSYNVSKETASTASSSVAQEPKLKPKEVGGQSNDKIRIARRVSSMAEGMQRSAAPSRVIGTGADAGVADMKAGLVSVRGRKRRETVGNNGVEVVEDNDAEGNALQQSAVETGTRRERAVARRRSMML